MFRPTWSERLPSPFGCAAFADMSNSRAVLIGLPARITTSPLTDRRRPDASMYRTAVARRPLRVVLTR